MSSMPRVRHRSAGLCALALIAVSISPAAAIVERGEESPLAEKVKVLPYPLTETVDATAAGPERAPFDRFVAEEGGRWWGRLERGSGRAALLSGSGLPIAPGRGNDLAAAGPITLDELARRVRAIVARHPDLLGPTAAELVVDPARSRILLDGRLAYVDFALVVGGREVEGAHVFARINNGNLIQIGTRLAGGFPDPPEPVLDRDAAVARLWEYTGGRTELDRLHGEAELGYIPLVEGDRLRYALVWTLAFRRQGEVATWTARIDARTGEVLEFFDANRYGRADGGVYQRTVVDPEIVLPLPFVQLDDGRVTDRNGAFSFDGGLAGSGLDGRYFSTSCEACSNPSQARVETDLGLGWLRFGTGGVDEVGNGVSTKAERNSFFHLNVVRMIAKKWLDIPWLDSTIVSNVNIQDTCNAFYNGSVNFYRSGGGCNNTGEIADVMQHEWGHGIDGNTNGGDSATGEGTADHVAFLVQHHPVIGPYFRTSGAGVRNVDKDQTSKGLLTRSNVTQKCGPGGGCSGPLGRECHCEGEIYGQAGWDLSQALVAKHGFHTGWQVHEKIFYTSLPQAGTYLPDQPDAIYDAYLAADDDDGDLSNGTPNGQEIFDAFSLHEIAGSPVGSSPGCTRPAEPVVTATSDCGGVTLSWDAVPGAAEYRVMRNVIGPDRAFLPLATVSGTSYTDGEVTPDVTYHYVVEAVDATGCTSTIENVITTTGPARPVVGIVDVITDDTPRGNRSGTVDPGEAVDVTLVLENISSTPASGLVGTIATTTPGVTIDIPTQGFPDVGGLATTQNPDTFRFSIDSTVACGGFIDFTFDLTDDSGCTTETQHFRVRIGTDEVRQADDFSTDNGWSFDAASSTATTGDWTRGVPDGTSQQPGADSDDAGTICWFTAPNAGGAGTDDVDDGEVVLVSPLFDLSALGQATLAYQRWFGNRDVGEDPDDFFLVEASDDGGATWQQVERLGTETSAAAWTDVSVDLDALIALTDQVQFRVRVSDGTLDGNLIEGAFDDFRITEPVCDDTPPCFVPPTFDGIDTASAGPDCAEASLTWSPAVSHCTNAEITYTVYRSTDPAFAPSDATRIAAGLTGTSFLDTLLEPGQTYHYIVRAFDSRSGEDGNVERHAVVAPSGPDTKPPVFDGLASVVSGAGCGETILDWAAAAETCSGPVVYNVYRSTVSGFTPDPSKLIATTTDVGLVDAGLSPDTDYFYIVRAADQAGMEDDNAIEGAVTATVLPETITTEDFEAGAAGWARSGTNDATTGLWELGDPVGTDAQPGDCPSGVNCWATGLSGPGLGDNDVDDGTTTLLSGAFDLTGMQDPAVRYLRHYSNDTGGAPNSDTWTVEISGDDGVTWSPVEQTQVSDPPGVFTEIVFPITGVVAPSAQMRLRFIASDLGDGSVVEAVVDDFETVDLAGGCDGCAAPDVVGTILARASGDDVVLDWTADPVAAGRYKVYTLSGPTFADATFIGSTDAKTFTHVSGGGGSFTAYRVSSVNACGEEGALE